MFAVKSQIKDDRASIGWANCGSGCNEGENEEAELHVDYGAARVGFWMLMILKL